MAISRQASPTVFTQATVNTASFHVHVWLSLADADTRHVHPKFHHRRTAIYYTIEAVNLPSALTIVHLSLTFFFSRSDFEQSQLPSFLLPSNAHSFLLAPLTVNPLNPNPFLSHARGFSYRVTSRVPDSLGKQRHMHHSSK